MKSSEGEKLEPLRLQVHRTFLEEQTLKVTVQLYSTVLNILSMMESRKC